jgi:hypothetical protein
MSDDEPPNPLKEAALEYGRRHWHVIPLWWPVDGVCACPAGAQCESPAKHPRSERGEKDATDDLDDIDYWWSKWPLANIGIVTKPSGLAIADLDGPTAIKQFKAAVKIRKTLTAITARGFHLYYQDPHGRAKTSIGKGPTAGIDLRASTGFVVAPPSIHATGHTYTWAA